MKELQKSLKSINYKLLFALLLLGLCPTIYTTFRVFLIGTLPGEYSYSIAGQLSWINLIYEVLREAIILPLFFFIGKVVNDKGELENRVATGLFVSFGIYLLLSIVLIIFVKPLLGFMAAGTDILDASATYIRIESVANIIAIISEFLLVVLVTIGKEKYVYGITAGRVLVTMATDVLLVSSLPCSLNLGINGIGYSNILVNVLLAGISVWFVYREGICIFKKEKRYFAWMRDFLKVGGISGVESFVRNIAYMLMICRMVNVVGEQGTYWVANNFIWGYLLLPVTQLAELIKRDCATDENAMREKTGGYFALTALICLLWGASIPLWKPFMSGVLGYGEVDKLFELILILLGFYVLYAFQNVFDATFYGLGKTNYMLFESVVTNTVYYGGAFVLYKVGVWVPSLTGIALLFGIGMAFDSIVSLGAYLYLRNQRKRTA